MSVQLEGFNIIIPRVLIDSVYPGGSEKLLDESQISNHFYDDNIVRFGASDTLEVGQIIEEWTGRGLRDIRKRKGKRTWIDLCLIDSEDGLTLPCKWIKIENGSAVFLG
jgi:hypothetical protein